MRKFLSFVFIFLSFLTTEAQIIEESLTSVACNRFEKGVLVSGIEEAEGKGVFILKYYDGELNLLKKISRPLAGELLRANVHVYGKHIEVYITAKPNGYHFTFSDQLEEVDFAELTPELKLENKAKRITFDSEGKIILGNYGQNFIGNDIVDFDLKTTSVVKYKYIPTEKIDSWCWFQKGWGTTFSDFQKVKWVKFVSFNSEVIVVHFFAKGKDKVWNDVIVKLDAETGKVLSTITIVYAGDKDLFRVSESYYDQETANTIVLGIVQRKNLTTDNEDVATIIFIYDKIGNLISSKTVELNEHKIEAPPRFNLKRQYIDVHKIGKGGKGRYFVITERNVHQSGMASEGATTNNSFKKLIGYSYFEIDETCNVSNEKMRYINDFWLNSLTIPASRESNEKFVLYKKAISHSEERKDDPNKVQFVDFGGAEENPIDVCEKDEYEHVICDDHHAVLYRKSTADLMYLRSVIIK